MPEVRGDRPLVAATSAGELDEQLRLQVAHALQALASAERDVIEGELATIAAKARVIQHATAAKRYAAALAALTGEQLAVEVPDVTQGWKPEGPGPAVGSPPTPPVQVIPEKPAAPPKPAGIECNACGAHAVTQASHTTSKGSVMVWMCGECGNIQGF